MRGGGVCVMASVFWLGVSAAAADPLPNVTPDHDFSGTYLMTKPGENPKSVAVAYGAAARVARIAPQDQAGYVLYDFAAHDARMVMPPMRQYMDMKQLSARAALVQGGGASGGAGGGEAGTPPLVQTLGRETIAGQDCQDTKITDAQNGHWTIVCATEGGVILRLRSDDGADVVAQTISEAAVPAADLEVPAGYTPFAMPQLPAGMQMPGGMQMPPGVQLPPGMSMPGSAPGQ